MSLYEESSQFLFEDPAVYGGELSWAVVLFLSLVGFFVQVGLGHVFDITFTSTFPTKYPAFSFTQRLELVQNAVCFLTVCLIGPMYTVAAYDTRLTAESRWEKPSYWGHIALLIHCSNTFYDLYLYVRYFKKGPEMYLHHVLVLCNYLPTLVTGHLSHWAYWDGTVEFTNVFLCYVYIARILGYRDNIYFMIMAAMVLLSFVFIRVVGMGLWLYTWRQDLNGSPEMWARNKNIARHSAFFTTVVLFLLSSYWLIPITKGFLKAIGVIKKKKENNKKEN